MLVGDPSQLPPVKGVMLAKRYTAPKSLKASSGLRLFMTLFRCVINLKKNQRARSCTRLPVILDHIRNGVVSSDDLDQLNRRSEVSMSQASERETIVITPRQKYRDHVNRQVMHAIHLRRMPMSDCSD